MKACVVSAIALLGSLARAQPLSELQLARLLADDTTRQAAVDRTVALGNGRLPLLLAWTRKPPPQLNELEQPRLLIGMADVFGRLKTNEAIPFLIKNIRLHRTDGLRSNIWMKTTEAVLSEMPAISALTQLGSPALEDLMSAYLRSAPIGDRVPLIFTISRIGAVTKIPRVREFLMLVRGEATFERTQAEEGLNLFDGGQLRAK